MNKKLITRLVGTLLLFECFAFVVCLGVSLYYGDSCVIAFMISAIVAFVAGGLLRYGGRNARTSLTRYDSFVVVFVSWLACVIVGMLPYMITGATSNVTDAFFETMSGFTTTGATVIDRVESLPHGILFWRALTHWVGGLGIVIFTLALLPSTSAGETRLFAAEVTGPKANKLHPRFKTTLRWLFSIYMLLNILCAAAFYFLGMGLFDSVCHAFSVTATGGFSTHSESMAFFHSPAIEYVTIAFMFLAGMNFTMLYMLFFRRKFKVFFTNSEIKAYVLITVLATAAIACCLYFSADYEPTESLRHALFQVLSIETTSGFVTANYMSWIPPTWVILAMLMFGGACAGSTSGGFKIVRIVALFKITINEFKYILHPRAVIPIRINNGTVSYSMEHTLLAFIMLYIAVLVAGTLAFSIMDVPLSDAVGISLASLSNVGIDLGHTYGTFSSWSAIPPAAKWLSTLLMLAGRLEIFTLIMLFIPRSWKDY